MSRLDGDDHIRVAIDARSRSGSTGGVQQFTLSLLHSLNRVERSGILTYALSFPDGRAWLEGALLAGTYPLDTAGPRTQRGSLGALRRRAASRFPVIRQIRSRLHARAAPGIDVSDGTIERAGIQVMHFVRQGAFRTDVPSIYHPWDLQHVHLPEFFTRAQRDWRDRAYRAFCDQAAQVVVATTWTKRDLIEAFSLAPERIAVIPVPFEPTALPDPSSLQVEETRLAFDLPDRFLLYPAQTWPHKNHSRLLRAIADARSHNHETVALVLTGYVNEHGRHIRREIRRLRLDDQVWLLGYVTPLQLQALYRLATGMVFPSLFEGWGIPIVEAFNAGTAVACSTATSLPALVRNAAVTFDPYDVDQIREGLLEIWTDEDLRTVLAERGKRRVAQFQPEAVAAKYVALYKKLGGIRLSPAEEASLRGPALI